MGRNKKDAAQDVLTLYNQMQEDEIIEEWQGGNPRHPQ